MAAKEKWVGGDIPGAQAILSEAFKQNEDSESIFLAAAKLASGTGEMEAAKQILEKARAQANTDRVSFPSHSPAGSKLTYKIWMKSAVLERQLGNLDASLSILDQAITKFPTFDKLHMIRGQIFTAQNLIPQARTAYAQGCKACPRSIPLWILAARLEETAGVTIKARSLLEKARLYNAKNDELWAESIGMEERTGGAQQAKSLLARGKLPLSHQSCEGTTS
jgi:pre-mRNA-processing factor 6